MKKIQAVLFDLDNTLYAYEPCNNAGKRAVFLLLERELHLSSRTLRKLFDESRANVHERLGSFASAHSRLLYIQGLLEKCTGKTSVALTLRASDLFWKEYMRHMILRPGIREMLRELKSTGIRTAIVSDLTSREQMGKITRLKVEPYIDFLVTSEEAGREKPSTKLVSLALHKLKLTAKDTVLIGDSVRRDGKVAQKLGIPFQRLSQDRDVQAVHRKLRRLMHTL